MNRAALEEDRRSREESPASDPARRRWVRRAYALLLVVPLLVSAAAFGLRGWSRVVSPNELGYGEGLAWFEARHILDRTIAHRTMPGSSYIAFLYLPLHPLILRVIAVRSGSYVHAVRAVSLFAVLPLAFAPGTAVFLYARSRVGKLPAAGQAIARGYVQMGTAAGRGAYLPRRTIGAEDSRFISPPR
jgi:hypothetical protein